MINRFNMSPFHVYSQFDEFNPINEEEKTPFSDHEDYRVNSFNFQENLPIDNCLDTDDWLNNFHEINTPTSGHHVTQSQTQFTAQDIAFDNALNAPPIFFPQQEAQANNLDPIRPLEMNLIGVIPENTSWSGGKHEHLSAIDRHWMNSADCGQYASNNRFGTYGIAVVTPQMDTKPEFYAEATPHSFPLSAAFNAHTFSQAPIPITADAVAYCTNNRSFHYAKIHRQDSGDVAHLSHTDAMWHNKLHKGGTFSVLEPNESNQLVRVAQRGISEPQQLTHLADFVQYCEQNYGPGGRYFFCAFR